MLGRRLRWRVVSWRRHRWWRDLGRPRVRAPVTLRGARRVAWCISALVPAGYPAGLAVSGAAADRGADVQLRAAGRGRGIAVAKRSVGSRVDGGVVARHGATDRRPADRGALAVGALDAAQLGARRGRGLGGIDVAGGKARTGEGRSRRERGENSRKKISLRKTLSPKAIWWKISLRSSP